ncbi:MAG: hypothetical protein U0586_06255 [Candidatus Brocadiaceae bacterium]
MLIPVDPSIYSLEALDNLKHTFRDIRRMEGRPINKITVILNRYHVENDVFAKMFQKRHPSHEVELRLREMFTTVFTVPEAIEIYDAQKKGFPYPTLPQRAGRVKSYEKIARNIIKNTKTKIRMRKPHNTKFLVRHSLFNTRLNGRCLAQV